MGKRCQQKKGLFDLNKKRLFVFACLMFFSFTVVGAAVNVSNSPTTSSVSPRVAVDSLGYVHVIWVELSSSSTGDLYYSRGNRDATQWTVPINLSQSNKVYCPSLMMAGIDVDACNRVYVVYVDGNQVKLRILADGVWGSAIVLDDRQGVDAPRVAVSPEGDIFAVWWAMSTYRVYSRARVGGTWESVRELSERQSKFPDIAVGKNIVAATWADKNVQADTYQTAYVERSRNYNASWSSPQWILPSSYSQKHQAIEFDSRDVPHLIWSTEIGGERIIEYTYRSGGGFVAPVGLSPQVLLHYPNLAEAKDSLFACWQVGIYGNGSSIDYNVRRGSSWEGYQSVPNSQGCTYSDVGVNPQADRVYFVWDTYAGSPGDIFIHCITYQPSGQPLYIQGHVRTPDGQGLAGVLLQGLPSAPQTSSTGAYSDLVYSGWSGTVIPSKSGYVFSPSSRTYSHLLANQLNQDFTASSSGCTYNVSPLIFLFPKDGGQGTVNVTASAGCSWSAKTDFSWISLSSGSSGSGSGTVQFSVSQNSGSNRTGSLIVAGQTVAIHQAGQINFNLASPYIILPECLWAAASGGGTWVTDVQIVDLTGGSQVSVYFNYGYGLRRGPITVWNNSGGELSSFKFNNFLSFLNSIDTEFQYYGRAGAVEFITQDADHRIQVMARIYNGNCSKTVPGLIPCDENTAAGSRRLIIPYLVNNASYRSSCGFFNPTNLSLSAEFRLYGENGQQLGSSFTRSFVGYDFQAFNPFSAAGIAYPSASHDQAYLIVQVVSGSGMLVGFGSTVNNNSNDPASHLAVQYQGDLENSPSNYLILPECTWSQAYSGGTWSTSVQIIDISGGSSVSAYFSCGDGTRRGPFVVWNNSGGAGRSFQVSNFLQYLGSLDSSFNYYGRVGAVEFVTQDASHRILVTARTFNGNYSKTLPGLRLSDGNSADLSRRLIIPDMISQSSYRSSCGFFNPTSNPITVEFRLINNSGNIIGSVFTKSFSAYDFKAFNPFKEAGIPYPAYSYDGVILLVRPVSGSGKVICFGASANNTSNDPAAHIALRY